MTADQLTEKLFQSGREYVALAMEHLVAYIEIDEDDLERLDISLQTAFLFPTLLEADRQKLCRMRYLGHCLHEARTTKLFGLTRLPAKRLRSKLRQLTAERNSLKSRFLRSDIRDNLTEVQIAVLKAYLRIERYDKEPSGSRPVSDPEPTRGRHARRVNRSGVSG